MGNNVGSFLERIQKDFPNADKMSDEQIIAAITNARDHPNTFMGLGDEEKRAASQAALDFIEQYPGGAKEALGALEKANPDTPLLGKDGKLNPGIRAELESKGAWPKGQAPSTPMPAKPVAPVDPVTPAPPAGGGSSAPSAPPSSPSPSKPRGGGGHVIDLTDMPVEEKAKLGMMVGLPFALLGGRGGVTNLLESMPPDVQDYLQTQMSPDQMEQLMHYAEMFEGAFPAGGNADLMRQMGQGLGLLSVERDPGSDHTVIQVPGMQINI